MSGALSQRLLAQVSEADQTRTTIEIDNTEFEVWSSELTGADFDVINRAIMDHAQKTNMTYVSFQQDPTQISGLAAALILKLHMVENGECSDTKAFTRADRAMLMRTSATKLAEWARAVFGSDIIDDDDGSIESIEKNS